MAKNYKMPDFSKGPEKRGRGIIFFVNMADIDIEKRKFYRMLGNDLKDEVKQAAKEVSDQVKTRLNTRYNPSGSSKRINSIISAMGKGLTESNQKLASIYIGNISKLDTLSKISRLDRISPEYHNTPFLSKRVRKKSGQPSKEMYSLWRILDRKAINQRSFGPINYDSMRFTMRENNYSNWIFAKSVNKWRLGPEAQNKRYWFLSEQREIYNTDKKVIYNAFARGVSNIILRTRFRFDGTKHAAI